MASNQSKKAQQARVKLTEMSFKYQDAGDDDRAWLAQQLAQSPRPRPKHKK